MADMKQGIEYEITAKDATGPGVESAKAKIDAAAKNAEKSAGEVAKDFKANFSPMSAITAALTGNFQALGQQLMGLASRLKNVHMSMMQFSLYAALVMSVVKAMSALADYMDKAKERAEKIRLDNAAGSLQTLKREAADFAAAMERARKDTEAIYEAQNREVSALAELTKAYNEFAKAQELALAKTDDERKAIETRYKSADAANARDISAEQRRIEREKLDADIERMKEELERTAEARDAAQAEMTHAASMAANAGRSAGTFTFGKYLQAGWYGSVKSTDLDRMKQWEGVRDSAFDEFSKAHSRIEELNRELADAEHRREMLDVKEEAAQYSDAAELQTELNDAWREVDEQEKKEVEEIKEAAVEAAEEVKQAQLAAAKVVKDTRMRDLQEATAAEAAAQQRLAAARAQVDRAWGWYRDKDSLARQIEEEKADAAARAQYEKDFDKLQRQRPDWEKAKNLSLDQEAVRRVALARREEESAARAALETAENTRRAAEALEAVAAAIEDGGE